MSIHSIGEKKSGLLDARKALIRDSAKAHVLSSAGLQKVEARREVNLAYRKSLLGKIKSQRRFANATNEATLSANAPKQLRSFEAPVIAYCALMSVGIGVLSSLVLADSTIGAGLGVCMGTFLGAADSGLTTMLRTDGIGAKPTGVLPFLLLVTGAALLALAGFFLPGEAILTEYRVIYSSIVMLFPGAGLVFMRVCEARRLFDVMKMRHEHISADQEYRQEELILETLKTEGNTYITMCEAESKAIESTFTLCFGEEDTSEVNVPPSPTLSEVAS